MSHEMPTRIAFCITELDPGGAERALVELITRLDRSAFEPAVYCLGPRAELAEVLDQAEIPVTCMGAKRSRDIGVIWRLTKALRRYRPKILQTWLYHANLLGRFAAVPARVPIVVSGIRVAERRSRWRLRADRWSQALVTTNVCVSQDVADFSIQRGGLNPRCVSVIPNGVEVERFANAKTVGRSTLSLPENTRVLLFVGRLDPQKDPLLLLEAFQKLHPMNGDVHLVYVGNGPLEAELKDRVARAGLEEFVHFLGRREDVPGLMKMADLLVLPSRWEGMPNVVLEAFASGTPVLGAAVEGMRDLVIPGQSGWLLETRSAGVWAEKMHEVLANDAGRIQAGLAAQRLAAEKFTWNSTCEAYQKLYRELLQSLA